MKIRDNVRAASAIWPPVAIILGGVFAVFIFFWVQFTSGFSRLYGDAFDGAIVSVLVAHWYDVLRGLHHWNEPSYFYPYADVLGYNDGYFIYGLIAAAFRSFGVDALRAMEFAHVAVRLIGYFSMYALLRRIGNRRFVSVIVSIVFTIALNSLNSGHMQLLAVSFAPGMTLLTMVVLDKLRDGRRRLACMLSVVWAALYGAWLMTGYYMAFFFGLFVIVFVVCHFLLDRPSFMAYVKLARENLFFVLVFVLAFVLFASPCLLVYLPKLAETGGQGVRMTFTQRPADIFNIGSGSLLWGRAWQFVNDAKPGLFLDGEHRVGFQPVFFVLFAAGVVGVNRVKNKGMMVLALAAVTLCVMVLRFGDFSLWRIFYYAIPGSKGVRVICRIFVFLVFPMSILIAFSLQRLWRVSGALAVAMCCVLIAEQVDPQPVTNIDVPAQLAVLDRVSPAPDACKVFYGINPTDLLHWPSGATTDNYLNVQSMQVADRANLPTINGFATFVPPDWNFGAAPADTYVSRVKAFAKKHGIEGLCQYDLTAGKWSMP